MNWDNYFINIAENVALKSKDPSTKVGCVLVTNDNRPISFGYNGFVSGCNEDLMSYARPMKYYLTIHAEMNALIFAKQSLRDCKVYITHAPCSNCLKHLLQAGIKEIRYKSSDLEVRESEEEKEAKQRLLNASRIVYKKLG